VGASPTDRHPPEDSLQLIGVRIRELVKGAPMLEPIASAVLQALAGPRTEYNKLHRMLLTIGRGDSVCRRFTTASGVGAVVAVTYKTASTIRGQFTNRGGTLRCRGMSDGWRGWAGSVRLWQIWAALPRRLVNCHSPASYVRTAGSSASIGHRRRAVSKIVISVLSRGGCDRD
jgi:hypothetical protein